MTFKEWFNEEVRAAKAMNRVQSFSPTADNKALTQTVQNAMQSPAITKMATQIRGNNANTMRKQAVTVAQNTLKNNPATIRPNSMSSITPLDVADNILGQFGVKPISGMQVSV